LLKDIMTSPSTLRVLLYMLLPLVSMVPGIAVAPGTDIITIDPHAVWPWLVGGLALSGGIFAVWGKK